MLRVLCRDAAQNDELRKEQSMNRKEIGEIKRRLDKDKGNISAVRGCYVNAKGEVISVFRRAVGMMSEDEQKQYYALFRKVLSGVPGKTGIDVVFTADQMTQGQAHPLLMELRDSALSDEGAVSELYQRIIDHYHSEDDYAILLLSDIYDVPQRSADGHRREDEDGIFTYVLCCVCPVKQAKAGLMYSAEDQDFRDMSCGRTLSAPELGFMFPAFDDRTSNIYNALYYVRNANDIHEDFVDAVFATELPMPGPVQKAAFEDILQETLKEDLSFPVMQAVSDRLRENVEIKKQDKSGETPVISAPEVKTILADCGLPLEKLEAFDDAYEKQFGRGASLSAANIVDTKCLRVKTPNVSIQVNPDFSDLVETRVIDGKKYILIRAEEDVQINGVAVSILEE